MAGFTAALGEKIRGSATGVFDYFVLAGRATRFAFSRPFYWRDTLIQMDRIGVGSLPIVLLTGFFTGMVLALQSSVELKKSGRSYKGRCPFHEEKTASFYVTPELRRVMSDLGPSRLPGMMRHGDLWAGR